MATPDPDKVVAFPNLKPGTRRAILGGEIGSAWDAGERMFAAYSDNAVLDASTWNARDLEVMLRRDGQAAAIESVLTLPIRQASRSIEAHKDDSGEADFCRSVLMTPHTGGGMKTPLQDVIGQLTSSQTFKKAYFEKVWDVRDSDGKIVYDKLAFRPAATCEQKRDPRTAAPLGFRQQVWMVGPEADYQRKHQKVPGYVDIDEVRSFVYVNGKHRQPLLGTSELDLTYTALAYNSKVQTPDGEVQIQDLKIGDYVFGVRGTPTRVLDVIPKGKRMMYRVAFKDGSSVECDAEHLWGVYDTQRSTEFQYQVMSTQQIMDAGLKRRGTAAAQHRFGVPRCKPVEYPERKLPLDPYILGAWLGDGSIRPDVNGVRRYAPTLASFEDDGWIADEVSRRLPASMKLVAANSNGQACGDYHFRPTDAYRTNCVRDALVGLGVNVKSPERFIPELYMQASVQQRMDLLRGLMDTDGTIHKGKQGYRNLSVFYTKSPRLGADIQRLVRSLGGTARYRAASSTERTATVRIFTEENPFALPRKSDKWARGPRASVNKITSIEATEEKECCCITVAEPDGLFLTNDYIVTHNCYQTKLKIIFLWLAYLEQQSLPKVIVYGQSQEQANDRADDVASMRASGIVGFQRTGDPGEKSFDVLESSGKGASQFSEALSFLETWQTSSVLAGFMGLSSLASLGRGSLALSQDQSAFFLKSRQAVTAEMEAALTHDVIAPLVTLNFGPGAAYPSFRFGALTDESDSAVIGLFQAMSVAPSLQVPPGILDIIIERTATALNLDQGAVEEIVKEAAKQREAQAVAAAPPGVPPAAAAGIGQLAGAADAAAKIYKKAMKDSANAPLPENTSQPFSVPNLGSGTQLH